MSDRQIFKNLNLFKKTVVERFLITTREIYKHHPTYVYHDDDEETGILIYPSYADPKVDGNQPRLIVKAGSYNYHLMDTMFNNMSKEVVVRGAVAGYEHSQIITIPLTVLIHAYAEEESSDLADEFASLVVYACRKMYSSMGLVIRGIQISETDIFNSQQKVYQTTASISLDVPWSTSDVDTSKPIGSIDITPEEEEPLLFDTYRSPGVSVFQEKRKDV